MQHITPPQTDRLAYVIGPYQEPGETFQISTLDAFGNRIDSTDIDLADVIEMPYVNPCTGPIYVNGPAPGDTLEVRIDEIQMARDYTVSCIIPEFGGLCGTPFTRVLNEPLEQRILLHPISGSEMIHDPDPTVDGHAGSAYKSDSGNKLENDYTAAAGTTGLESQMRSRCVLRRECCSDTEGDDSIFGLLPEPVE